MTAQIISFAAERRARRPERINPLRWLAIITDEAMVRDLYHRMVLVDFVGVVARACAESEASCAS